MQVAYRLLMDIGVVPSPVERELIRANREVVPKTSLNEWERAFVGDAEGEQRRLMTGMGRMMQKRAEYYDYELPTPERLRLRRAIMNVVDMAPEQLEGKTDQIDARTPRSPRR